MIKTGMELAAAAKKIAANSKTLYVMGCFGAPLTSANKTRYTSNHSYNKQSSRTVKINAASANTFGFDCVGLIKGLLWGWSGDAAKTYGGAKYITNGVHDINADSMISRCSGVSTNFSNIEIGEVVWMPGHIGIYIGDNKVVESTPSWDDGVQITTLGNISKTGTYRVWKKHGKLPYINYTKQWKPTIGDIVDYHGNVHYASANAAKASSCKGGKAKITNIYQLGKSKHPYHLVRLSGGGSNVYGWVDGGSFTKST